MNFGKRDYKKALYQTFLKMDDMMQTSEGKAELQNLSKRGSGETQCHAGCTANVALMT